MIVIRKAFNYTLILQKNVRGGRNTWGHMSKSTRKLSKKIYSCQIRCAGPRCFEMPFVLEAFHYAVQCSACFGGCESINSAAADLEREMEWVMPASLTHRGSGWTRKSSAVAPSGRSKRRIWKFALDGRSDRYIFYILTSKIRDYYSLLRR